MRSNREAFERHTKAFEGLMAAFDRLEEHFELASQKAARRRETNRQADQMLVALRKKTDEMLREMEARNRSLARRSDERLAELKAGCAASRVRRRELLEKADRLRPPAEAA